jgi:hypothetical protein
MVEGLFVRVDVAAGLGLTRHIRSKGIKTQTSARFERKLSVNQIRLVYFSDKLTP